MDLHLTGCTVRDSHRGIVIHGNDQTPIHDVILEGVDGVIARSSRWKGGNLDLRPMKGAEHGGLSAAENPGVLIRHARDIRLRDFAVRFADEAPWYGHGLDAAEAPDLMVKNCLGIVPEQPRDS